jgi:hypothetical protein
MISAVYGLNPCAPRRPALSTQAVAGVAHFLSCRVQRSLRANFLMLASVGMPPTIVFNGALDTRGDPGSRIAARLGTVGLDPYLQIDVQLGKPLEFVGRQARESTLRVQAICAKEIHPPFAQVPSSLSVRQLTWKRLRPVIAPRLRRQELPWSEPVRYDGWN